MNNGVYTKVYTDVEKMIKERDSLKGIGTYSLVKLKIIKGVSCWYLEVLK